MRRPFLSLLVVVAAPFLVRCGGDDSGGGAGGDAGADGAGGADGQVTAPGDDGGTTSNGDATSTQSSPPGWTTAPEKSDGCGMAATPSGTNGDAKTVTVNGTSRSYVLYVPAGYDPSRNYPVVLVYHGIGATGAEMAQYIQMQDYSAGNAIVAFPTAVNGNWDLSGDTDLLFFDALTKSLEDTLCVNERRVFALGFSLGAYMVNHLGCKRSDAIRAFIPADGGFPDDTASCGKTTVLVYHRTEDDNEAIANGEKARDNWIGIDGCKSSSTPLDDFGFSGLGCVDYDGCPSNTTVSWCEDTYISPQGYKHDLRDVYRVPMWNWFNHF